MTTTRPGATPTSRRRPRHSSLRRRARWIAGRAAGGTCCPRSHRWAAAPARRIVAAQEDHASARPGAARRPVAGARHPALRATTAPATTRASGRCAVTTGAREARRCPSAWSRVSTWCGWCARCRFAPPHAPTSAPPAVVPLTAPRRRQHARRRPVGAGRCQATYPLRSVASQLQCRLPAMRPQSAVVMPRRAGGNDGRARHVRREPGRLDARAPGALPPVPRGRAGRRRQRRRLPCRRPRPWPYPAMATPATSCTDSVGVAGSADTGGGPGGVRARTPPGPVTAPPHRSGVSRALHGDAGPGLSMRVTRSTDGAQRPPTRVGRTFAHIPACGGATSGLPMQCQHMRGGRHVSRRTQHDEELV